MARYMIISCNTEYLFYTNHLVLISFNGIFHDADLMMFWALHNSYGRLLT